MKYKINILLILAIFAFSGCQIASAPSNTQNDNQAQIVPKSDHSEPAKEANLPPDTNNTQDESSGDSLILEDEKDANPVIKEPVVLDQVSQNMPKVLDLPVAFASQAPFGVWDELHEETCEEASMIMTVSYFNGQSVSAHSMEQGLLNVVKWQENNGYKIDATAAEVVTILDQYYKTTATLSTDVSVEFIKSQLNKGSLIIVPAAGRELGNPYFSGEGPIYHMLVIRGYDDNAKEFITNDPGTKRGEGYRYDYQVLISAIHDWDHQRAQGGMTDEEMAQGRKVVVVIPKQ